MKRFQYMSGRWVKSHKIVRFPHTDFDPTKYLAPRDPRPLDLGDGEGVKREAETQAASLPNGPADNEADASKIGQSGCDWVWVYV